MITHYARLSLRTLSPTGVRQVYADGLGFPILGEAEDSVSIGITPFTTFRFDRSEFAVSPAHLAFEVRHSTFQASADCIVDAGLPLCGDLETDHTRQRYFKDGDGNLLEIYSHDYIDESALPADNPMGVLYLREVGFVVDAFDACWDNLSSLGMMNTKGGRNGRFSILASGTAHAVVNHSQRRWIPIAMTALKPDMQVTLGASEATDEQLTLPAVEGEGFHIRIEHAVDFDANLPEALGVPRVDGD